MLPRHLRLDNNLAFHKALKETERQWFWSLQDGGELSRTEIHGLHVVLEGILSERVPGFCKLHTRECDRPEREAAALCNHLLHSNNGFTPDQLDEGGKVLAKGEVSVGREWLSALGPKRPLTAMLAFYFKLRERAFMYHLNIAKLKAGIIQQLDLTPTKP